jgi:tight adherence protein B
MVLYSILLVMCWVGSMTLWWIWKRSRQTADLNKLKARLVGAADTKKAGREGPALIRGEDLTKGQLIIQLLLRLQLNQRVKALFEQAGLKWNPARTIHGSLALFLIGFTGAWYMAPHFREFAVAPGLLLGAMPLLYVLRKRGARMKKFEGQFPDSLEFLARSMRAGHAFSVALEMIHTEFQEPLAGEFRRAFDEQNLGLPLDMALGKMSQRVPLMDVHFFVSTVLLQKRTGGNLAEVLDKLAYLIRERFKLRGRIKAISAHGRMTGMVLSLIPIGVGLIMFYVNPMYVEFFTQDDMGRMMIGGAVLLQLVGYGVIKKIVSIEA